MTSILENEHTTCNCHQCTWLRASQLERAFILKQEPSKFQRQKCEHDDIKPMTCKNCKKEWYVAIPKPAPELCSCGSHTFHADHFNKQVDEVIKSLEKQPKYSYEKCICDHAKFIGGSCSVSCKTCHKPDTVEEKIRGIVSIFGKATDTLYFTKLEDWLRELVDLARREK